MNAKQAAEEAIRQLDAGNRCAAEVWLDVAIRLTWDGPSVVAESLSLQLAGETSHPVACWDCRMAKRDAIKKLEA